MFVFFSLSMLPSTTWRAVGKIDSTIFAIKFRHFLLVVFIRVRIKFIRLSIKKIKNKWNKYYYCELKKISLLFIRNFDLEFFDSATQSSFIAFESCILTAKAIWQDRKIENFTFCHFVIPLFGIRLRKLLILINASYFVSYQSKPNFISWNSSQYSKNLLYLLPFIGTLFYDLILRFEFL